jgi:orotidine-5'-phosphate decarboxylase
LPVENSSAGLAATATVSMRDKLIVALDFPTANAALSLVDQLEGGCRWFKVGLELYLAEGSAFVHELRRRGFSVFLDLKLHDIPNTVASAVESVSQVGAEMMTVHAAGGPLMLQAAAEAASKSSGAPTLLAVTILTSMDQAELEAIGIDASPGVQVERLAKMAIGCGVPGLVSSAAEVERLRAVLGNEPLLVIPGIRLPGDSAGDQKRIATPGSAIAAGASYLVVGRPITRAADPATAFQSVLREMQLAEQSS